MILNIWKEQSKVTMNLAFGFECIGSLMVCLIALGYQSQHHMVVNTSMVTENSSWYNNNNTPHGHRLMKSDQHWNEPLYIPFVVLSAIGMILGIGCLLINLCLDDDLDIETSIVTDKKETETVEYRKRTLVALVLIMLTLIGYSTYGAQSFAFIAYIYVTSINTEDAIDPYEVIYMSMIIYSCMGVRVITTAGLSHIFNATWVVISTLVCVLISDCILTFWGNYSEPVYWIFNITKTAVFFSPSLILAISSKYIHLNGCLLAIMDVTICTFIIILAWSEGYFLEHYGAFYPLMLSMICSGIVIFCQLGVYFCGRILGNRYTKNKSETNTQMQQLLEDIE